MRICPKCRTTYPAKGRATCVTDGTRLVEAREFAEAQADPMLKQIVAGRFHVEERIGVGGMGTVYKASQTGLDRPVALKILKRELAFDQDTVTRFHREAKAMSLLTHPNTVRVYDFGETSDGLLYFAMELLEGELLTSRVERDGAVDVEAAIRIARQVLGSLHEAHTKGIIHRDLKPDNIFLATVEGHEEPVVKVLDFGIAKIIQGDRKIDQLETQAGTVFGTPRYMSPEQAQGKPLDPRSDLYSVGILLYHMLTGRPPFVDDDAVVVMAKHIREKPEAIRRVAPDRPIPASLERIVLRTIEKDANKRFKSAEDVSRKLEAVLPDVERTVQEMYEGRTSGFRAFVRDMRGPLAIAGSLLAASIVAFVVIVAGTGEAEGVGELATERAAAGGAAPVGNRPTAVDEPAPSVDIDVETSTVAVTSSPEGAEVWWRGSRLGTTPVDVPVPAGASMDVELRLDGHRAQSVTLVAGAEPTTATLEPVPRRGADPASTARRPPRRSARMQDVQTMDAVMQSEPATMMYEEW
jgi:serine/threonine-protein kinase